MKVTTNEALIEQRSKWAKRLAPLTMLFLIGGLIIGMYLPIFQLGAVV